VVRFFLQFSAAKARFRSASGICRFVFELISCGSVALEEEDLAQAFIGIILAGSGVLLEISR